MSQFSRPVDPVDEWPLCPYCFRQESVVPSFEENDDPPGLPWWCSWCLIAFGDGVVVL